MKEYLNVSEIGRLFGIGVQTLHYYDRIGLLKPAFRDEKTGYRKYRFDQVYQLASIRFMRKMGYSIDDVRNFQNSRHPGATIRLLRERSGILQEQLKELMRINDAILLKAKYVEERMTDLDTDSIRVLEFPERYYIPIGTEEELYIGDSFYFYPTVVFYEKESKYFGALLEDVSKADETVKAVREVIPAGRYLTGYHKGSYETIRRRMAEIQKACPQYVCSPRIISFNIVDQFVELNSENYITEIQLQILTR